MTDAQSVPVHDVSHTCGCGAKDDAVPALDARTLPDAIRHGAIFGALGAIPAGGCFDLIAPHDPKPLLAQIEQREGGAIDVQYLQRGPEAWTLRLTRTI